MPDAANRIWLVEKHGRVFARLEDARWEDMFWVNYRVVDLTQTHADGDRLVVDPSTPFRSPGSTKADEDHDLLFSKSFWHEDPLPQFRHLQGDVLCDTAFAGGMIPTIEVPFVSMRSLNPPSPGGVFRRLLQRWRRDS